MNLNVSQAKRLIEAFIALMLGRRHQVCWEDARGAGLDASGAIHLPSPKTGEAREIALLTRLGVHEGGHVLDTQSGFAERLTREEMPIFNVLEDPRMERSQMHRFPGASLVLSRGLGEMLQRIDETLDAVLKAEPQHAVHMDMLLRGFLAVAPHEPIRQAAAGLLARLSSHIDADQRVAIDEAVARLPSFASSLDAEQAAREFVRRLRQQDQQQDQQQSNPEPSGQGGEGDESDQAEVQAAEGTPQGEQPQDDGPDAGDGGDATPQGHESQDSAEGQPEAQQGGQKQGEQPSQAEAAGGEEPEAADSSCADSADSGGNTSQGAGGNAGGEGEEPQSTGEQPPAGSGSSEAGSAHAQSQDGTDGEHSPQGQAEGKAPADSQGQGSAVGQNAGDGSEDGQAAEGEPQPAAGQPQTQACESSGTADQEGSTAFDLGELLRETLAARYGSAPGEQSEDSAQSQAAALTDEDLQGVAAALAAATPEGSLEDLLKASLAALASGSGEPDAPTGEAQGAGMSLGSEHTAPLPTPETRLQGVQQRLVTVLQRELQDKRRRPTRAAYAGGRVIPQRFWRVAALGDTKVFANVRKASGIDAAATVLLDTSESMLLELERAAEVTMAFSLALQRLGVRTRVVRFPGTGTVTETVQRFGESARSCVERCAQLQASGGTPIGAAVAVEMPLLLAQRRLKNVLVVVTDGQPGDAQTFVEALKQASDRDILVVGVGIGCDIRNWILRSVSVDEVDELPAALAKLFREDIALKLAA